MWLIYILVGLAGMSIAGFYVRRRLVQALALFGLGPRKQRAVRWATLWLIYAFPVLVIVGLVASRLLKLTSFPRFDSAPAVALLVIPFMWTVLLVVQSVLWIIAIDLAYLVIKRVRGIERAARVRAYAVTGVLAIFAVYTPIRVVAERGTVRLRHHQVGRVGPEAPFRIAFVADIQQDAYTDGTRAKEVYAVLNAEKPDVVLSGGDWINTGPDHIAAAADAAATLTSRLGTHSVRGDHEHFAYMDRDRSVHEVEAALTAKGVDMVSNAVRWFEHRGKRIGVVFLDYTYVRKVRPETVQALLAEVAKADYAIAVTHQLDRDLAALLKDRVDLVLGAHTHGGQVNPVIGVTHIRLARLETTFVDGRYPLGARTTVIVTAGVGYSVVPFRYAAPGSMEIIDLFP